MHSYFLSHLGNCDDNSEIEIEGDEARHMLRVLRARVGTIVRVFNGVGGSGKAQVIRIDGRQSARLKVLGYEEQSRGGLRIHIAVAVAKGDRFETMLDMLTQIGVDSITPILFERSVVQTMKLERCQKIIIEACKQSRRNWLPQLNNIIRLSDWHHTVADRPGIRWVADPSGQPFPVSNGLSDNSVSIVIGPEGGITEYELERLVESGFQSVKFNGPIMRIETAAVAFASIAKLTSYAG